MKYAILNVTLFIYILGQPLLGCKLWAVRTKSNLTFTELTNDQLENINNQLTFFYYQSNNMPDGWALMGYNQTLSDSVVPYHRSSDPATIDSTNYWETVSTLLNNGEDVIGIGHLRAATSGNSTIPNPHPWMFYYENKSFSLIHNGTINKNILYNLITENGTDLSWLEAHEPQTFNEGDWRHEGWNSIVDSELLLLYIMQQINYKGEILSGLELAILTILSEGVYPSQMNIVFSDGVEIYAFGGYNGLYFEESSEYFSIMTTPPNNTNGSWQGIEGDEIIVFSADSLTRYSNFNSTGSGDFDPVTANKFKMSSAYPNPFNGSVRFTLEGYTSEYIFISILSLNGSTVDEFMVPEILNEKRVVTWSPGTHVSSGMYIISAMSGSKIQNGKILFIK